MTPPQQLKGTHMEWFRKLVKWMSGEDKPVDIHSIHKQDIGFEKWNNHYVAYTVRKGLYTANITHTRTGHLTKLRSMSHIGIQRDVKNWMTGKDET